MYLIEEFEKKTPSKCGYETIELPCGKSIKVYTIKTVHDLTQFIGYGKYMNCQKHNVYLRGQTSLYSGKMTPSLYRNKTNIVSINQNYSTRINKLIKEVKSFQGYNRKTLEPLLQHYGIKTPYIDLVDNVWVALWFSLHQAKAETINSHEHIYYYPNENEYSYIFLIATDALKHTEDKGIYVGESTILADLRNSLPSYFLRPHAQHAYMLRKKDRLCNDYSDLIVGIARIPTKLGFEWMGNSEFLTVRSLFPAAYFDSGYKLLLKNYPENAPGFVNQYGSIQIITD